MGIVVNGTGGDDSLLGGSLNDTLVGGVGNDTLDGGADADSLVGGMGNDVYYVDNPGDVVRELGGQGVDEVRTTLAVYTLSSNVERLIYVGSGNWRATGDAGANHIAGGRGNDTLNGGAGDDTLNGGSGNDTITGSYVSGGDGDDLLTGGWADGGQGNDTLYGNYLYGGSGDDRLVSDGKPYADFIGGGGTDTAVFDGWNRNYHLYNAYGNGGKNYLLRDGPYPFDDVYLGGITYIEMEGITYAVDGQIGMHGFYFGRGSAGAQTDIFITGFVDYSASDAAVQIDVTSYPGFTNGGYATGHGGYAEGDTLAGVSTVIGSGFGDVLTATDYRGYISGVSLNGGGGNDTVTSGYVDGGDGNDLLTGTVSAAGGSGNDTLYGSYLDGGDGNDRLYGSGSHMTGGAGKDVFVFTAGTGSNTIDDFVTSGLDMDVIRFDPAMFANWSQVWAASLQVGSNVVISTIYGDSISLLNVGKATLTSTNFQFGT